MFDYEPARNQIEVKTECVGIPSQEFFEHRPALVDKPRPDDTTEFRHLLLNWMQNAKPNYLIFQQGLLDFSIGPPTE